MKILKIKGILVCMLMIIPVLAMTVTADPGPEFEIEIKGGYGVTAIIKNIGDENASEVHIGIVIERPDHTSGSGTTEVNFSVGETVREHKKSWWIGSGHRAILPAEIEVKVGFQSDPFYTNATINALLVFWFVIPLSG